MLDGAFLTPFEINGNKCTMTASMTFDIIFISDVLECFTMLKNMNLGIFRFSYFGFGFIVISKIYT